MSNDRKRPPLEAPSTLPFSDSVLAAAHQATARGTPGLNVPLMELARRLPKLMAGALLVGALTYGASFLLPPGYTARVALLPPQQNQSGAMAALASLGSFASLVGGSGGRNTGEQLVALMQSVTISDRIIDRFGLMQAYKLDYRIDTRKTLASRVRIALGKKDGLIAIEVDDRDPKRAADMANAYVEELRRMTATLAVSEAQQRRVFFEGQLKQSRDALVKAQQALQSSGFDPGALKTEVRVSAEAYARLRAEVTAAEVRLQTARGNLTDNTPEIRQQQATLGALRSQLARAEQASASGNDNDYISRFREFKYQETLFELYARQFELARVDESREGALIQVIDTATPPEKNSSPRRAMMAGTAALVTFMLLLLWAVFRPSRRAPSA